LEELADSIFYPKDVGVITYTYIKIIFIHYILQNTLPIQNSILLETQILNSINIFYTKHNLTKSNLAYRINK